VYDTRPHTGTITDASVLFSAAFNTVLKSYWFWCIGSKSPLIVNYMSTGGCHLVGNGLVGQNQCTNMLSSESGSGGQFFCLDRACIPLQLHSIASDACFVGLFGVPRQHIEKKCSKALVA
jgi:hypothetical protein